MMRRTKCFFPTIRAKFESRRCVWAGRWGDSPLRWFEVMLFLDFQKDVEVLNISYLHDKVCMWEPVRRRRQNHPQPPFNLTP